MEDAITPLRPNILHPVENTNELLKEFDSVYNALQYTHLTPPATPPQYVDTPPVFQTANNSQYIGYHHGHQIAVPQPQPLYVNNFTMQAPQQTPLQAPTTVSQEVANQIQLVDEIVRERCQDLPDMMAWHDENTSSSGFSRSQSPRSESDSCYGGSGFSNDEDWELSGGRWRPKPYSYPTDEKRFRKKEQNKNAATRYRLKKKQEVEGILVEEKQLSDVNEKLTKEYGELKREVKYLKNLMRELFKARQIV